MRFRGTWILLLIALAGIGYFFAVEQPRHKRKLEREEQAQKITTVESDSVLTVEISRPDATLEFSKKDGNWIMTLPYPDNADQGSVNTLVRTAVGARIESKISPTEGDLSPFGLSEPAAVLTFGTRPNRDDLVIRVGNSNITKSHCYALVDTTSEIVLLPEGLRRYALRDIYEFRDKRIVDLTVDDVSKFEVAAGKKSLVWERPISDRKMWVTAHKGDTIRGDVNQVESILRELRGLRAQRILPDDPANFPEHFPKEPRRISIWTGPALAKKSLLFGKHSAGEVYVKEEDKERIAAVDTSVLHVFDKSYQDLRDRRMLHFDRDKLSRITIETPDTIATLVKLGNEWSSSNPTFGGVDQGRLGTLLYRLESVKFTNVISERVIKRDGYGFSKPSYRVTLYEPDDRIIDEFAAGTTIRDKTTRYATSKSTAVLAGVEENVLKDLKRALEDLRPE